MLSLRGGLISVRSGMPKSSTSSRVVLGFLESSVVSTLRDSRFHNSARSNVASVGLQC